MEISSKARVTCRMKQPAWLGAHSERQPPHPHQKSIWQWCSYDTEAKTMVIIEAPDRPVFEHHNPNKLSCIAITVPYILSNNIWLNPCVSVQVSRSASAEGPGIVYIHKVGHFWLHALRSRFSYVLISPQPIHGEHSWVNIERTQTSAQYMNINIIPNEDFMSTVYVRGDLFRSGVYMCHCSYSEMTFYRCVTGAY